MRKKGAMSDPVCMKTDHAPAVIIVLFLVE
jgi:hypothetical protein